EEGGDFIEVLGSLPTARERQLHVVERHLQHVCPRSSLRTGGEESLRCSSSPISCAQSTWIFWTSRRIASCSKRLSPHQRRQCSPPSATIRRRGRGGPGTKEARTRVRLRTASARVARCTWANPSTARRSSRGTNRRGGLTAST